jgi:hypothetical protein
VDSVLLYLCNHGQHINNVKIEVPDDESNDLKLCDLPHSKVLGLSSLSLLGLSVQLQPGGGFQGVVGAGIPLKKLQLHGCKLLDYSTGLAAAAAP